jgi:predicted dehydrogenase
VNVGLIGFGKMGSIHYRVLQTLKKENIVDNIYVFDKEKRDIPEICSLAFLLEKSDCVIVSTPTITHREYVDMCIQYRKPVFCEKPFTDGYTDDDLYYRKWAGVRNPEGRPMLFVGYIERYNSVLRRFDVLLDQVRNDSEDSILYFATRRVNCVSQDVMCGREILTDLGVHDFDMLRYLFGSVKLESSRIITTQEKAVFAQSLFKLDDSVFCDSVISWIDTYKRREYVVYTVKKVITVDLLTQSITVLNRMSEKRAEFTERVEPAYVEMQRFLQMVKDGVPLNVKDPLGLDAQKIAVEILENAEAVVRYA